jgi:hypothetical protein
MNFLTPFSSAPPPPVPSSYHGQCSSLLSPCLAISSLCIAGRACLSELLKGEEGEAKEDVPDTGIRERAATCTEVSVRILVINI